MNTNQKLSAILRTVAVKHTVSVEDIISMTRKRDIAYARHVYCYIAVKLLNEEKGGATFVSLQSIGKFINRDHATVMHSARHAAADLIATDKKFATTVSECLSICASATHETTISYLDHEIAILNEQIKILQEERQALLHLKTPEPCL
jgi:hypothetical protein